MNELDICTICNNKDIEPTVCISCWSSNYEKGALEELNDEKCFLKTTKRFNAKKWNNALEERLKFIILRIKELEE